MEAVADVSTRGAAVPRSWDALDVGCQRLYAVRTSCEPPLSIEAAASALGIPRGAAEERWLRIRMTTGVGALEPTSGQALGPLDPTAGAPVPIPAPEFVSDTDLKLLARRRGYQALIAADPADPRSFKDLTASFRTLVDATNQIADNPLELRRSEDRESLRALAEAAIRQMALRGITVHAQPVVDVTPQRISDQDV